MIGLLDRSRPGGAAGVRILADCALAACLLIAPGCASKADPPTRRIRSTAPSTGEANPTVVPSAGGARTLDPIDNPRGWSLSLMVRAGLMPLGSVPYDGFVLPLVSPDGRHIATQTGTPPDWPTTLAEPGAVPPYATVVEIYRLDVRDTIRPEERQPAQRIAQVNKPVVLGRSVDGEGFLVEAPQEDGSRIIGKASWTTGEIRWLVEGGDVNAFASLAPDGRLAWCRRAAGDPSGRLDLVVRDILGQEWIVPGENGDWLMPVWSTFGDGLFALHRAATGRLRLCYGQATGAQTFRMSLRDFILVADSDKYAAYQALSGQTAIDASAGAAQPQIMLLHPTAARMAMWKPLAPRQQAALSLNARSLAALQHSPDAALVCLKDELLLQSLRQADANMMLTKGTWVPRRTPASGGDAWPYLLLSPGSDGRILLTALRLLPLEHPARPAP